MLVVLLSIMIARIAQVLVAPDCLNRNFLSRKQTPHKPKFYGGRIIWHRIIQMGITYLYCKVIMFAYYHTAIVIS